MFYSLTPESFLCIVYQVFLHSRKLRNPYHMSVQTHDGLYSREIQLTSIIVLRVFASHGALIRDSICQNFKAGTGCTRTWAAVHSSL